MTRMINASVMMVVVFLTFWVGIPAGSFAAPIEVGVQTGDNPWRIVRRENPRASEQEIVAEVAGFLKRNNISDPTKIPVGEIVLVNRLDNAAETAAEVKSIVEDFKAMSDEAVALMQESVQSAWKAEDQVSSHLDTFEQGLESFRNDRNKIMTSLGANRWNTVIFGLGVVVIFGFGVAVVIYLKKGLKALDVWETKSVQRQNVHTELGQELVEALNKSEYSFLVLGQAVLGLGRNAMTMAECFKSADARVSAELARIKEDADGKNGPGSPTWRFADSMSKISQSLDAIYRSFVRDTEERFAQLERTSAEIKDFIDRARTDSEYAIEGKHPLDKFASRKQVQDVSELVQDIAWELNTQKKRLKKLEQLKGNFTTLQDTWGKLYNIEFDSHRAIEKAIEKTQMEFKEQLRLLAKKEDKK